MRTRTLLATLAAAGVVVTGFAVPASAASDVCTLTMIKLTAEDLQEERGNGDEISVRLGDTRYPRTGYVKYTHAGESHTADDFGAQPERFVSSVAVGVTEVDPLFSDPIGDNPLVETCHAGARAPYPFHGDGAIYVLEYTVTVG
jgi:hypothetical protein